jgi:hypothetical protein
MDTLTKETLLALLDMVRSLDLSVADLLADFSALRESVKVESRFLPKQAEQRAAAAASIAGGIQRIDDLIRRLKVA